MKIGNLSLLVHQELGNRERVHLHFKKCPFYIYFDCVHFFFLTKQLQVILPLFFTMAIHTFHPALNSKLNSLKVLPSVLGDCNLSLF